MIEQQSQDFDPQKRLALVHQIQKKLSEAGARPTVSWGIYNFGRMQEVWLDQ